jgi:hypothetical protein
MRVRVASVLAGCVGLGVLSSCGEGLASDAAVSGGSASGGSASGGSVSGGSASGGSVSGGSVCGGSVSGGSVSGGSAGGGSAATCVGRCFYVRQGGSGQGTTWADPLPNLPPVMVRGATYYVADGSYGSHHLSTPNAGTQTISIVKATEADHGTNTGWRPHDGDGQATFTDFILISDFWVIDGRRRNEADWTDGPAYGFRNTGEFHSNVANFTNCSDDVTIKYVDVGGTFRATYDASNPSNAFYMGGFGDICERWLISRVFAHNVGIVGQMAGVNQVTWEYSWLGLNWSKEILRGQIRTSNVTVRNNIFKDGCRDDHAVGTGCTAEIAFFGNLNGPPEDHTGARIEGNVIWKSITQHNSDGCIIIQHGSNGVIYNNTFVKAAGSGHCALSVGGSSTAIRNNVWLLPSGVSSSCTAAVCDHNTRLTSLNAFVDAGHGDFRLSQPIPGVALGPAHATDLTGATRGADGMWDQGAFER